jgi:hypothetical protein
MEMRKIYETDADGKVIFEKIGATIDAEASMKSGSLVMKDLLAPKNVVGVEMLLASPRWHVSPEMVLLGATQGWLVLGKDTLTVRARNGSYRYLVKRTPGHYCCHCTMAIADANGRTEFSGRPMTIGEEHVARLHGGEASPDPNNPSGFERINYLDCLYDGKE